MNLAEIVRPKEFSQMAGQKHLLGENAPLMKIINSGHLPSLIFYGPPGVGKTFMAKRLAYSIIGEKDDNRTKMELL